MNRDWWGFCWEMKFDGCGVEFWELKFVTETGGDVTILEQTHQYKPVICLKVGIY